MTAVNPTDGASGVAFDATIIVDFSEDLDPASLAGNVELRVQGAPLRPPSPTSLQRGN